ncbi:MAG: hypothetical protein CTY33_00360 [Methylotenera sp.]|nr:MAG: hypothetical protein CTY33_00360 [Methylotenera sp.]
MKPWEKYASETPAMPAQEAKPWEKYQAPVETEQPSMLERIPRAVGLTARVGMEAIPETVGGIAGLAKTASNFTPAGLGGMLADKITGNDDQTINQGIEAISGAGRNAADFVGLPKPETSMERIISAGGKAAAGAGGVLGAAGKLNKVASPAMQTITRFLSAAPKQQIAGAVGSGVAGQTAKESGAGVGGQIAASVLGGLGAAGLANTGANVVRSLTKPNSQINPLDALEKAGINTANLSDDVKNALTLEVQKALKVSPNLDDAAVGRLADYQKTGLTPMSGNLTLNPATITQERNLAKIGANSTDPAAQKLSTIQRENDLKLMDGLGKFGSDDDAVTASNKIIETLNVKDAATKKVIGKFYEQARNTEGRSALLNPRDFTQKANDALDEALLGGKLPSDVRNKLNSIAQGETPLTVDVAEQLKTNIGALQRSSNDPAERLALSKVREALDNTALVNGQGKEAIEAFNRARAANRAYMQMVERNPALQAVRDGVEPDKFVQKFILGSGEKANISQVKALRDSLKDNPEATTAIRGQIANYLKSRAVNGKADEVANFSPDAYNKALKAIGDDKLKLFFTEQDLDMLKTLGRVSSYEKFQPTGAAVNNSNTTGALTAVLDRLANSPLIRKIPFGAKLVAEPAQDISVAVGSRKALNQSKAIALPKPKVKGEKAPLASFYGLAAVEEGDD